MMKVKGWSFHSMFLVIGALTSLTTACCWGFWEARLRKIGLALPITTLSCSLWLRCKGWEKLGNTPRGSHLGALLCKWADEREWDVPNVDYSTNLPRVHLHLDVIRSGQLNKWWSFCTCWSWFMEKGWTSTFFPWLNVCVVGEPGTRQSTLQLLVAMGCCPSKQHRGFKTSLTLKWQYQAITFCKQHQNCSECHGCFNVQNVLNTLLPSTSQVGHNALPRAGLVRHYSCRCLQVLVSWPAK